MKPTIGRIVHYVRPGSADGKHPRAESPAIVTDAWPQNPEVASLCVLNPNGMYFNTSVPHDEGKAPSTWHWPEREDEDA